jgi:class 3 adenylate cyclase
MTMAAPSGEVTFLFTDVEGSTRRSEADADLMRQALAAQDKVLRSAIETHGDFNRACNRGFRRLHASNYPGR